jgi:hypothetical protein
MNARFDWKNEIVYFEVPGKHNTDTALRLAKERATKLGTRNIVVASTTGFTAERALEILKFTNTRITIVGGKRKDFSQKVLFLLRGRVATYYLPTKYHIPIRP